MLVINDTPFAAERIVTMDKRGAEVLILVAKGTYDIIENNKDGLPLASEQIPIQSADEYYGEPGKSSVRYESDLSLLKVGTDVVLLGHAYPLPKKMREVDVTLTAGKMRKTVRVFGDRVWDKSLGRYTSSAPDRFEKIPLRYELAFGGVDSGAEKDNFELRNPVGIGFHAAESQIPVKGTKLPNIENPRTLIKKPTDRPGPAAFGFVGKSWVPRKELAGTYDSKWMTSKMPLLPDDFNDRFNNGASEGLVATEYFSGGEVIEISNVTPMGRLKFTLPQQTLVASMLVDAKLAQSEMNLDSVIIDSDNGKLMLVWRAVWNVHRVIEDIRWLRVQ